MESFFTLLFLDKKKQKSRLASSATSHCTLRDAGRTRLTAQTASGLPLHFAGLVPASGNSGLPGVTPLHEQGNKNMIMETNYEHLLN
ncbi:MAG: hypothetical protein LBQ60_14610 [Bacteroidales bacterium]|jgi:hypothetical protein|nr:hypothetical protein [Bacteroidales bacterium]